MSDFKLWGSSGTTKIAWQEALILASLHRVMLCTLGRMISAEDPGTKYRVQGLFASSVWMHGRISSGGKVLPICFFTILEFAGTVSRRCSDIVFFSFLEGMSSYLKYSDLSLDVGTFPLWAHSRYVCSNGLQGPWNTQNRSNLAVQ